MLMELGNGRAVGQVNLGLALRSRALELCWRQAGKWHGMSSDSSDGNGEIAPNIGIPENQRKCGENEH